MRRFCDACSLQAKGVVSRACPACPSSSGALKRTFGGQWGGLAHVICTQCIPETYFLQAETLEEATGFDEIPHHRRDEIPCSLCDDPEKKWSGAKLRCAAKECSAAFHVTCAQGEGLLTRCSGGAEVFCRQHSARKGRCTSQKKRKTPS